MKPEFNPNSTQSKPKHSPNWKRTWKNCWKIPSKKLPQTERPHFPIASALLNQVFRKKKSKTSLKKSTRKKKQPKNTLSNIDDIDEMIEHCLQKAENTFSVNTSLEEFSNQWTLDSAELE
jgi:hypothetical protein